MVFYWKELKEKLDQFLDCVKKLWKSKLLTNLIIDKKFKLIKDKWTFSINLELFELCNSNWNNLIELVNEKIKEYWLKPVQESINNYTATEFIRTVVKSANRLWLEVVAEWVEGVDAFSDEQVWDHLKKLWISILQWYSIHKPSPNILTDDEVEEIRRKLI